jgi:hypothetical protein
MAGASTQEKIDEAAGKFSPCRGEAAGAIELPAQLREVD